MVVPHVALAMRLLDQIGEELKKRGIALEQLIQDSEQVRQEIFQERYGDKGRS